eukprot:jgi/Psemu1/309939/fgenesh1_kg.570_\
MKRTRESPCRKVAPKLPKWNTSGAAARPISPLLCQKQGTNRCLGFGNGRRKLDPSQRLRFANLGAAVSWWTASLSFHIVW